MEVPQSDLGMIPVSEQGIKHEEMPSQEDY
jgi:hypothetical protein